MIIGTRQKLNHLSHDMEVHIGEKKLKQVTSKKVLGVTIDDQLSWEEQVDNISKKVSQGIACYDERNYLLNIIHSKFFTILWLNHILSIAPLSGEIVVTP